MSQTPENTGTIRWERDADGIVVLTLDDPAQSANTMNAAYRASMAAAVDRLEAEREDTTGVVITSAKKTFFAGGDLNDLMAVQPQDAARFAAETTELKSHLRRLETLGRPVVAAMGGAALGGGLEIALACHHRIVVNDPRIALGLPEVTLGLLPGAGGVVRTVRLLGVRKALTEVLLEGRRLTPAQAEQLGLVDTLVDSPAGLLPAARAWIKANPGAVQPWDTKGYKIPGGAPSHPALAAQLPAFPATLRKQQQGADHPAPRGILCAAVEGAQVDFDTALKVETEYFVELATGQVAKNMIKAFFFDLQHINSGGSRPEGYPKHTARKAVVAGAGMMGAGIAHVCATAGIQVVLKDTDLATAQRGKAYSAGLLDKAVGRGRMTRDEADAVLARISPTDTAADATGADLLIEAVYEDADLKKKVLAGIEGVLAPDAVIASNTSSLPITELAEGVGRPADFVGLHFFSPVDRMPLLEIVTGKRTSDATLAKALDIALQLRKTPIVVNDSRGFFTTRVIATYLSEAVAMLGEGVPAASIEQAGGQAGYPTPPLRLLDELTLTLVRTIREGTATPHPGDAVLDRMTREFGRTGRSSGAGFYDYVPDGSRSVLWPGLADAFGGDRSMPMEDLKERLLFAEAIETVTCFDEGVLRSVPDANIGSILGIGFPGWTGGVMQYIDGYPGGRPGFVARARELTDRYGERFTPPVSLVAGAETGESIR